jgi:ABC-type sugar transport system substrate-binding protein
LGIGNPSPENCQGRDYAFGIDVFSDKQDYAVSWERGLQEVATQMGCVELSTLVDNADAATALGNVKTLIQRNVDGVILFQIVAGAQPGIMRELDNAGIPAVAHAVPAPGAPFVSPNDTTAGTTGGQALGTAAAAKFAGQTPWLILGTDPATGDVSANRLGGVRDGVLETLEIPDNQIIEIDTQSKPDVALTRTIEVLPKIPDGTPILFSGINDDVVGGIFQALKQSDRLPVSLGVGMGGLFPSGVQLTCENPDSIIGTVDFLPETAGKYMIPALVAMVNGQTLPEVIDMDVELLDKAGAQAKYPDFEPCQA